MSPVVGVNEARDGKSLAVVEGVFLYLVKTRTQVALERRDLEPLAATGFWVLVVRIKVDLEDSTLLNFVIIVV
ncbi:hypothetical protein Tco_1147508 [Tanacetum coccineum]